MSSLSRFTPRASLAMKNAITQAGGVEVFAIGQLNQQGLVDDIQVHCRGNKHSVPALLSRPKAGEVVIHNHPSGILQASDADLMLANLYGEDGVGVIIVNNDVTRALWVVEPYRERITPIAEDDVRHFFTAQLPKVMDGYELRKGQLDMALQVTQALNNGEIAILEAGTGTGKSLAYLVPAVLWAIKNRSKIAVATFTINLQSQLVTADIPIMQAAGLDFRYALLKGRGNYLCRRRLAEKAKREPKDKNTQLVSRYAQSAKDGTRADIPFAINDELWDDINSDHEQTLRARCPHFEECFYYQARRKAADAQLLIVNHHLLLADMIVKKETGREGILPAFNRVIVDEGHHLEDSATSLLRQQLSNRAVRRAISPLVSNKKRPGALERIAHFHVAQGGPLPEDLQQKARTIIDELTSTLPRIWDLSEVWFQQIANDLLTDEVASYRLRPSFSSNPLWNKSIKPILQTAAHKLGKTADRIIQIEDILQELPEQAILKEPQPILDLRRARRRLSKQASFLLQFYHIGDPKTSITEDPTVRWVEKSSGRLKTATANLCYAPIDVGPTLRDQLFCRLKALVSCSATMTVNRSFEHYQKRMALLPPPDNIQLRTAILASPFDYQKQAILGLTRHIPDPSSPQFIDAIGPFIMQAIDSCGGGVFVLCTSFSMVRKLAQQAERKLGHKYRIFRHGQMGRVQLLDRFLQTPNAVLFGADSFWEGISVKGDALRMVIIPRLPFRVPTQPVLQARHELIEANGENPFTQYSLPQATLRLRQGFGRLIRTQKDRGIVLILDPRVDRKWYGKIFLNSLPSLKKIRGNPQFLLSQIQRFFVSSPQPNKIHGWGPL